MAVNIFICDDEQEILSNIEKKTSQVLPNSKIIGTTSGLKLIQMLSSQVCDILLLDIDMPGISGLDIAKWLSKMEKKPLLVFVTSHDELVYDSLQFHPFGFVRKGHMDRELSKILLDCASEIFSHERHFSFYTSSMLVKLQLDDILYFEADGNYLKLYAGSGEYRFRDTLAAVDNALSASGFIRVHKGFLVNQSAVKVLSADEAQLLDGTRIPIGRSYSEDARKRLMRYMMK